MSDYSPSSNSIISQRLKINYTDWGNPDAPPLLLLHGGRDHSRNWDWTAQRLRDHWHIIAPDLRGHGDSDWTSDGDYDVTAMVYDLAQLIHQLDLAPLRIVAHSLGGDVASRYTALYPDKVLKLVNIEGLGRSPAVQAEREAENIADRLRTWIETRREASHRVPRRYATLEAAVARMQEQNRHLSDAQARHLTFHGVRRNEDGTWSWKFDPCGNSWPVVDLSRQQVDWLWHAITCPVLLIYGVDSWSSNPRKDGRMAKLKAAKLLEIADAGHWLHHDQFEQFITALEKFL